MKNPTVKSPLRISKRSFFGVYRKHFSPILSKSLSNCREINQKLLVAYADELNSHLRHINGDKCDELPPISSLGNMSLCVNHLFLVIISETKPEYCATKPNVQLVKAWRVQFASNEKKRQPDRKVL